jgi:hypothetical protein
VRSLDEFLPVYEFSERHRIEIAAPRERIDRAVRAVTAAEIPAARALFRLRGLHPGGDRPILEELAESGVVLDDVAGDGLVVGLSGQFWRFRPGAFRTVEEFLAPDRPDVPRAVADFRVQPGALTTETRVHVADPAARRKFARYWRAVRPFSGLTRILILRAAKKRAEAG